jgi:hypothetical protein
VVANHEALAVTYDIINDGNLDVVEERDDSDSDTEKSHNRLNVIGVLANSKKYLFGYV